MADTKNTNPNSSEQGANERLRSEANQADNQTMRHEQAKAQVSGQRQEKSAIGGGQPGSQTGEPGRARDELDKEKNPTSQHSDADKSRKEPAGQQR